VSAEVSNALRAVEADFFFNCWCSEIPWDNPIRQVPRHVHYHAQSFLLEKLWDNSQAIAVLFEHLKNNNAVINKHSGKKI
jgi:hypothetical protein